MVLFHKQTACCCYFLGIDWYLKLLKMKPDLPDLRGKFEMYRPLSVIAIASLAGCLSAPLLAADAATCEVYAKAAVTANDRASRMACPIANSGPRWQSNYNNHYQWCLGAATAALVGESNGRDQEMITCEIRSSQCEAYAEQSTRQYARNQQLQCGFTPATAPAGRWSDNHKGHYGWCMTAQPEWRASESKARADALNHCFAN